jgi:photosynthetic reaction center cytochrome c subunit
MKSWLRRLPLAAAGIMIGYLVSVFLPGQATAQAPTPAKSQKSGEFFKNVTTTTLKELTPDDFLSAMGVMADSLGWDCSSCHPGAGTDHADWVIDPPVKKMARRMVDMVAAINRTHFNGAQTVTCYTCHHARDIPASTISLDALYSTPNQEKDDVLRADPSQPAATAILDKYIAAIGGQQRLNGLASYVATGESIGYEGLGGNGSFVVYAKAPDQRSTQISYPGHPDRGTSVWSFNGRSGWTSVPRGLLGTFELTGVGLDGSRFEAQLAFPGQIKTILTNWKTGLMESMGDQDYQVIQGSGPRGLLVKLYFDAQTGLLTRMIRFTTSPIGRVPTQIDYSDYRDVGGIKFPFEYSFLWLDGRYTAKLSDIKVNVPIDAAKFGKP